MHIFKNKDPMNLVVVSGIVLIDRKILLQKRKDGFYSTPGGKVEKEEDPLCAVIRELKEEIDITIDPKDVCLVHAASTKHPTGKFKIVISYLITKFSGTIKNIDKNCQDLRFFNISSLPELVSEHVKISIKRIYEK